MELYESQKEILQEVVDRRRCALYCAPGTGKTFMSLVKARDDGAKHILVVCQKSMIDEWIPNASIVFPDYRIINLRKEKLDSMPEECFVGVINYDSIWRRDTFLKWRDYTLILDESSMLQNEKSKRGEYIERLRFSNLILLSGTPISGKYEGLYLQMKLLGYKKRKTYFYDRYVDFTWEVPWGCEVGSVKKYRKIHGYKNINELKRVLRDLGCVFRSLEDVCDLPDERTIDLYVDAPKELKEFAKERIINMPDGEVLLGDTTLGLRIGMKKLSSFYNPNKKEKLIALMESLSEERVVIFYIFKRDFELIKECIGNRPLSFVNGDGRDLTAYESYHNSVIALQYQSASYGLNLQKSHYAIFFSYTEEVDKWMQAKARIRRSGQKEKQIYYNLITKNSVEEKILIALKQGKDYTDELFVRDFGQ